MRYSILMIATAALLPLAACSEGNPSEETAAATPASVFMAGLRDKCGRAFRGTEAAGGNEQMQGKELILAIAPCEPGGEVKMAVHVNVGPLQVSREEEVWDRSRTITLSDGDSGLTAKLGQRNEDGSAGPIDGTTTTAAAGGSDTRQNFSVPGAEQPLKIELGTDAITLNVPDIGQTQGYSAQFQTSDRVAMPPEAWGDAVG